MNEDDDPGENEGRVLYRAKADALANSQMAMDRRARQRVRPHPSECPHCEYDRRFPGFEAGGWMQQDNNGPIVSCPICNDDGKFERQ